MGGLICWFGDADVRKLKHARILLKADEAEGGPGWPDERIVEAHDVGLATVRAEESSGIQPRRRPSLSCLPGAGIDRVRWPQWALIFT